jgi:hypothetical protein
MPRRTYNPKAGRRRPTGTQGAAFLELQAQMENRHHRPAPSLPADATRQFEHRPGCRGSSLTTFNGTRGDLMARCHSCGALQIAQEAP